MHPEQEAAGVDLVLQMVSMVLADQARQGRAGGATRAAQHRRGNDGARERAARGEDCAGRGGRVDIDQKSDYAAFGIADGFG